MNKDSFRQIREDPYPFLNNIAKKDNMMTATLPLHVTFHNESNITNNKVFIGFLDSTSRFSIVNSASRTSIKSLTTGSGALSWYKLSELNQGLDISHFNGKIYICYTIPWSLQNNHQRNYEPIQTPSDHNYFLRYDKFEMTYTSSVTDTADITSIDYWSIPISLQTLKDQSVIQRISSHKKTTNTHDIFTALNKLSTPPRSKLQGASPAIVESSSHGFARIIGPSSYPNMNSLQDHITTPYPLLKDYLQYLFLTFQQNTIPSKIPLLGQGVIAIIKGQFMGVGTNAPILGPKSEQPYDLKAYIDKNLNISLQGFIGSKKAFIAMDFLFSDIVNPYYASDGNTPYSINGSEKIMPGNDIFGWISDDLFAGFTIGAIGSSTLINNSGTMAGSLESSLWFDKIPRHLFFKGLQPKHPFYNIWASTLSSMSDTFNSIYDSRLQPTKAILDPNKIDTLQIKLENYDDITLNKLIEKKW